MHMHALSIPLRMCDKHQNLMCCPICGGILRTPNILSMYMRSLRLRKYLSTRWSPLLKVLYYMGESFQDYSWIQADSLEMLN